MISKRSVALMFMAGIVATMSCVDGRSPTGLDDGRLAAFALLPELKGPAAVDISASINRVRITVRAATSGAGVDEFLQDVDPGADEWEIALQTRVPADGDDVILTVELLNVVGGVTSVVWSGRVGPLALRIGQDVTTSEVELYPGPPSNLSVTGVSVAPDSATLLEGDTLRLVASVETTEPDSEPEPYWYSLDPGAIVDSTGLVLGMLPGEARIVAQVGAPADTVVVFVDPAPAQVSVDPPSAIFTRVGQTQTFAATVQDARGDTLTGWEIAWRSQDEGVVVSLGGGQFQSMGGGTTSIEALVVADTLVRGAADVEVQVPVPAFYAAPGNTQLVIGAYPAAPGTPHVSDGAGLVTETPALTVVAEALATTLGGSVVLEADGSALYTPPAGSTDVTDEFYYHVTTGDSALVSVDLAERVWYIDSQNGGANASGRSHDPVLEWVALSDVTDSGDIFYVGAGNYQTTIFLDTRQQLIGSGADLVVSGFGTLVAAGAPPVLFDVNAPVQMVGDSSAVRGLTISAAAVAGATLPEGIIADAVSGITIEDVSIVEPTTRGLLLRDLGGVNTITGLTIDRTGATNPAIGIEVFGGTGQINVDGTVDVVDGVLIQVDSTAAGSAVNFNGTYSAVQADTAIRVIDVQGDVFFDTVSIGTGTNFGVALGGVVGSARFRSLEIAGTTSSAFIVSGGSGAVVVGVGPNGWQIDQGSSVQFRQTDGLAASFGGEAIVITGAATGLVFDGLNNSSGGEPGNATFNNTVIIAPSASIGISMNNSSGAVRLDDAHIETTGFAGIEADAGTAPFYEGALNVSGTLNTVGATGIDVAEITFDTDFQSVVVDNRTGTGPALSLSDVPGTKEIGLLDLQSNDVNPAFDSYHGGTIRVTDPASRVLNGAGGAIRFSVDSGLAENVADMTLASISASGTSNGVSLGDVDGLLTIAGGTIDIASSGFGAGFVVTGGSATVSYGGEIQTSGASSVVVSGKTGGTVTFSGPITDRGLGIDLQNNTNTTINLTGDLVLNTNTFAALTAVDGGTINVTGSDNSIATTTGQPVEISGGTIIGSGGVSFLAVDMNAPGSTNGPGVGIRVVDAGPNPFVVSGEGTPGSGGTLTGADTVGVVVLDDANVTLNDMIIESSTVQGGVQASAAAGTSLQLALNRSTIRDGGFASNGVGFYAFVDDGASADITLVADTIRDYPAALYVQAGNNEFTGANAVLRIEDTDLIYDGQSPGPQVATVLVYNQATLCADLLDVRTTNFGTPRLDWNLMSVSGGFGLVGYGTSVAATFAERGVVSAAPAGPPVLQENGTFVACTAPLDP